MSATPKNFAKSAARALQVLDLFGALRRPVRAVEVAAALELAASSTDQLLKSMTASGHLVFDLAAKTYFPSPKLLPFGGWLRDSFFGDALQALLDRLHRQTGEIITLATVSGGTVQLIDTRVPGDYRGPALIGLRVPVLGSTLGGAYLGSLDERQLAYSSAVRRGQGAKPKRIIAARWRPIAGGDICPGTRAAIRSAPTPRRAGRSGFGSRRRWRACRC